ncbi:MAG: DUF5808 domain-containing protein [Chthoniobacterales bacterium]
MKITPERLEELWKSPVNWRAGLFYHCPEDPRIIVPKRQKWRGWTINFARRGAIPVLVGCVLYVTVPLGYVAWLGYILTWVWWTTLAVIILLMYPMCWYLASPRRFRD